MPDGTDVTLLTDGTFEGLLTAVFDSYSVHPAPISVHAAAVCQQELGRRYLEIRKKAWAPMDTPRSGRVFSRILYTKRILYTNIYDLV